MEKLRLRYTTLLKAYSTLEKIIELFLEKRNLHQEDVIIIYRDSVIKRFEFCYDITWKYLQHYLSDKHGISAKSPKTVFQECLDQKIVSQEESRQLLSMVDDRNITTHQYSEERAQQIVQRIINYSALMKQIAQRTPPGQ